MTDAPRWIEYVPLSQIVGADRNPREHDLPGVKAAIRELGFGAPALHDGRTGRIVAGHGRRLALLEMQADGEPRPEGVTAVCELGEWKMPVVYGWSSESDEHADAMLVADNRHNERGGWNQPELAEILGEILGTAPDLMEATGYRPLDIDTLLADAARPVTEPDVIDHDRGEDVHHARRGSAYDIERDEDWDPDEGATRRESRAVFDPAAPRPSLADRFLIPPFDVLDTRQGWWQARKRRWLNLGIRSEIGRAKGLTFRTPDGRDPVYYDQKNAVEAELGHELTHEQFQAEHYQPSTKFDTDGTSTFDPVLCELFTRWFVPPGGLVLDPFAGGSVRGLMACLLGRRYHGNDLAAEQVEANESQAREFAARGLLIAPHVPQWTVGDSVAWLEALNDDDPCRYDALFTCPPYWNVERYSDDPNDLSNMNLADFEARYRQIMQAAGLALKGNRFAGVVIGDVREPKTGRLIDLRGMTIRAAADAGLTLVSSAVVINHAASLAVRVGRWFEHGRTLGRCHQSLLVFVSGDRREAAKACGDVDVTIPDHLTEHLTDALPTPPDE